jgi:hypothetical protein
LFFNLDNGPSRNLATAFEQQKVSNFVVIVSVHNFVRLLSDPQNPKPFGSLLLYPVAGLGLLHCVKVCVQALNLGYIIRVVS